MMMFIGILIFTSNLFLTEPGRKIAMSAARASTEHWRVMVPAEGEAS